MHKPLQILSGPLATEAQLLGELAELQAESRQQPGCLLRPIRILVPSSSLRMHLAERITSELGCMLGVEIQTLQSLALSIVQESLQEPMRSNALVEVLCGRAARRQAPLREALDGFDEGLQGITGSVRDLFDAGYQAQVGEALTELIDEVPLSKRSRRRARSILEVAHEVERELAARGTGGRAALFQQATEVLRTDPEALPSRQLFVHGFGDVTGRASDLLQCLAQRSETRFLIDHPRDPASEEFAFDRGIEFTQRLLQPLEGLLGTAQAPEHEPAKASPAAFSAGSRQDELREVARRIRVLLDGGARAERIGIVAREPQRYAVALRRQLRMLGVPFSAPALGAPLDGIGRRILAFWQLVEEGANCPLDRWFQALGSEAMLAADTPLPTGSRSQALMGLRVTGAGRLGDLLRLKPELYLKKGKLNLPLREGVRTAAQQEDQLARFQAPARSLSGSAFEAWIQCAGELSLLLAAAPQSATAEQHAAHLQALQGLLGWAPGEPAALRLQPALNSLFQGLGAEPVTREEYLALLKSKLLQAAAPPLGRAQGAAGVQVLDVMEARGRTFEHLFLIGLNRDVFPRSIGSDPIFPDEMRMRFESLLPDMPILSRGRLEDRYLFAQLLSASEDVTLSWLLQGEDGKPRMLSPLVERLFEREVLEAIQRAPTRFATGPSAEGLLAARDAHEQAILMALHGALADLEAYWKLGLEAAWGAGGAREISALADIRCRVLRAYEVQKDRPERMAPWLGFVGSQEEVGIRPDPLLEAPYVTPLEGISRCPWQTLLTRFLRLERCPDPLEELPGIDARTLGNIVHEVLCRIDQRVLGKSEVALEAALEAEPQQVDWPLEEELESLLFEVSESEVRRRFEPVEGLVRVHVECAKPYLEAARELQAAELKANLGKPAGVLGAEVHGRARVKLPQGDSLELVFKVDRVERQGSRILLSDYKTGSYKPQSKLKSTLLPQGTHLQPMAYIQAALAQADEVTGRYLFLGARELKKEELQVALDQDCDEQLEDFQQALGSVVAGWRAGSFFPRLTQPDGTQINAACEHCEVREACLQGDSAANAAMLNWGQALPRHAAAQATGELWQLHARKREKAKAKRGAKS